MRHAERTPGEEPFRIRGRQLPALDGLRGVAILLVMLHHFTQSHPPTWSRVVAAVYAATEAGWLGVDLFFVLSGFLITSILVESRESASYYFAFYSRRVLRIFPLYYAALLVVFYVLPALDLGVPLPGREEHAWYWLYGTNVDIALHGWRPRIVTHFWSLAVEEHFYLVWPLAVRAARGSALAWLSAATLVGVAALRGYLWLEHRATLPIYVLTPTRMDLLAAGALLAALAHGPRGLAPYRRAIDALGLLGVAGLVAIAMRYGTVRWDVPTLLAQSLTGTVTALAFTALLARTLEGPRRSLLRRALGARWLRALGRYSYGLYVMHLAVDEILAVGIQPLGLAPMIATGFGSLVVGVVVRVALSLALAMLSYHLFERWFLAIKPKYRGPVGARRE